MVEIREDFSFPVMPRRGEFRERGRHVAGEPSLPDPKLTVGLFVAPAFEEAEKVFFSTVHFPEVREVFAPRGQQQLLPVGQVGFPLQEDKPVVHESSALGRRERLPELLADPFDRGIGHLEHVELVNDNDGLGQDGLDSFLVRPPHVHGHQLNPRPIREPP